MRCPISRIFTPSRGPPTPTLAWFARHLPHDGAKAESLDLARSSEEVGWAKYLLVCIILGDILMMNYGGTMVTEHKL